MYYFSAIICLLLLITILILNKTLLEIKKIPSKIVAILEHVFLNKISEIEEKITDISKKVNEK